MSRPLPDIVGKRFGMILVVEIIGKLGKYNRTHYKCTCDCGKSLLLTASDLSKNKRKSCGCDRGHPYNSTEPIINEIFGGYKNHANDRQLEFNLTKEAFIKLIFQNCEYCGSKPASKRSRRGYELLYNGIDRVNNTRGYTVDNCVTCCGFCNWCKKDREKEEFLNWIKQVYEHNFPN